MLTRKQRRNQKRKNNNHVTKQTNIMSNFINCDYHNTERKGQNPPVNLNLVTHILAYPNSSSIEFVFEKEHKVGWYFANVETRDLEYNRILKHLHI